MHEARQQTQESRTYTAQDFNPRWARYISILEDRMRTYVTVTETNTLSLTCYGRPSMESMPNRKLEKYEEQEPSYGIFPARKRYGSRHKTVTAELRSRDTMYRKVWVSKPVRD